MPLSSSDEADPSLSVAGTTSFSSSSSANFFSAILRRPVSERLWPFDGPPCRPPELTPVREDSAAGCDDSCTLGAGFVRTTYAAGSKKGSFLYPSLVANPFGRYRD